MFPIHRLAAGAPLTLSFNILGSPSFVGVMWFLPSTCHVGVASPLSLTCRLWYGTLKLSEAFPTTLEIP